MKKVYAEGTGNVFGVFHLEEATCERRAMISVIETLCINCKATIVELNSEIDIEMDR